MADKLASSGELMDEFAKHSQKQYPANKAYLLSRKSRSYLQLDKEFHALHEEVFERMDCLQCANCCKTTSPVFYQNDIERAAKHLRIKPGEFITTYLDMDEDGDFVFKSAPCPFLGSDNYCGIYDSRPKACREYPHTNRKRMVQILNLTAENTRVCPAVFHIVERMRNPNE